MKNVCDMLVVCGLEEGVHLASPNQMTTPVFLTPISIGFDFKDVNRA